MHAYLHCLSHSPLVGYVDPAQEVLDEVNGVIASARERIAAFSPELVVLFAPDHYNGFFYDVMPPDAPRDKRTYFREINYIAAAFQYQKKNYKSA